MMRFAPTTGYVLELGGDGQFTVIKRFDASPSSYIETKNDEFFEVGQKVQIRGVGNDDVDYQEVLGFTNDGIILLHEDHTYEPWEDVIRNYMLASSNSEYAVGQVITYHTDPSLPEPNYPSPPSVCFVTGTLIETDNGAVAIESLSIGDKIISSTGLRTVKWVGWRHYQAAALRTQEQRAEALPVRILAEALGNNLPNQDLRVSPWHHLFIDGVLIRAKDLINGKSILQETNVIDFSYFHIELDQFDVILAHGVFSESWADGGNRSFFQNVDVTTLRPKDMQRRRARRPGFKVLREADEIAVIHKRIAVRAEGLFIEPASRAA